MGNNAGMDANLLRQIARRTYKTLQIGFVLVVLALAALFIESHLPKDQYMDERHGTLTDSQVSADASSSGQQSEAVTLTSDSGLTIFARVLRDRADDSPRPVMLVLGGHRTGRDAVDLFDVDTGYAVVALDYPYDGPERIRGIVQTLGALPKARRAFLDTPPAVSLVLDWLDTQPWAGPKKLMIGASLGVPFAAKAAVRDPRINGVILVHGAANNERWLALQVARRIDSKWLHRPLGRLLHWLAYGPTFDSRENVARIAPRPVLIIGARQDERTPASEVEALYSASGSPKRLRWTDGLHVEPERTEVIDQMMGIAAEELPFLLADEPDTTDDPAN